MPARLELPKDVYKLPNGRWRRECPNCGEEVTHLRRNYCVHSSLLNQPCKRCSNINNHPSGMCGVVRVAWFNAFMKSALSRGLDWNLDIEDIALLHELQGGKCALSGRPIAWSEQKWDHSASIDRINNQKGYSLDNIQLVDKQVNMARGSLSVEEFVSLCQDVADKVKW